MPSRTESNVKYTWYELQFLGLKLSLEKVSCFILVHLPTVLVEFTFATDLTNRIINVNCSHQETMLCTVLSMLVYISFHQFWQQKNKQLRVKVRLFQIETGFDYFFPPLWSYILRPSLPSLALAREQWALLLPPPSHPISVTPVEASISRPAPLLKGNIFPG